jgi:type I restriction enzyme S subunit
MNFESLTELTTYLQRGISPKYAESGIPVINQKCIRNGQLRKVDIKFHSREKTYSQEKELRKDDILVNSTGVGTLGRVARFSSEDEKILADSHVTIVRPDVEKVFPLYLFYVLRLNEATIVELGAGSTGQTELSRTALGSLQIPIPSQSIQKYVADTLAFIDEKIDTNETLSKTLEDIAQTIFKSWFIDFDPVKAKMAGEKPVDMDDGTAALFPDSMEESELGLIPTGWAVGNIKEICTQIVNGSTPLRTNSDYWNSNEISWFKTGELSDNYLFDSKEFITELALQKTSVKELPSGSVLMAIYAAPTVGRLGILTKPSTFNQACTGMTAKEIYGMPYLYLTLFHRRIWFNSLAIGAAQQNISKVIVEDCPVVIAHQEIHSSFLRLVSPIFSQRELLSAQSNSLAAIRDALLPRLISGELKVPEEMLIS